MRNITTVAVYGDDFIARDDELNEAKYKLKEGNSIALFGLRRIGKSSMLQQLEFKFKEKEEYLTIKIDCQILETKEAFLMAIFNQLPNKDKFFSFIKNIPKPTIDKLKLNTTDPELEISFKKQIIDYLDEISNALEKTINNNDKKIILFLDELPYFFENMLENNQNTNDIKKILSILKFWRNNGICMAICGSIQINYFLDSVNISNKLLAGLNSIDIGVFSKDESFALLDKLAQSKNIEIDDDKKEEILELIGDNTPFFIQSYFAQYFLKKPSNKNEMKILYEDKVFPDVEKEFLKQFDERFSEFDETEKSFIKKVFYMISDENSSTKMIDIQSKINNFQEKTFLKLLSQEFIIKKNNNIAFSFNIVKKWWIEKRS